MGDQWSELPTDVLMTIHDHLVCYVDKFRFRYVCTHWQSSSPARLQQPPWLLLPYRTGSSCGLYHPFEKKVYEVDLPVGSQAVFIGSGHGWVVTQHPNGSVNVVNPISRTRVPLPPSYKLAGPRNWSFVESWLRKIAISCSPRSDGFRAVALWNHNRLSYCKVGDDRWVDFDELHPFNDIVFSAGKLYVTCNGVGSNIMVLVCDDIVSYPKLRICCGWIPRRYDLDPKISHYKDYVIDSSGDGLMILREKTCMCPFFVEFELFKLDLASSSWIRLESMGDRDLFIGLNGQMGICSRVVGENRTYYARDELKCNINPVGYECGSKALPIWFTPDDVFPYDQLNVSSLMRNFPIKREFSHGLMFY